MPPTKRPRDFDNLSDVWTVDDVTHKDEQIAELQESLEAERDARREDRFFFILIGIILFDVVVFSAMENTGGPLAILVLEALILIPVARRLGLEEAHMMLNRVIGRLATDLKDRDS